MCNRKRKITKLAVFSALVFALLLNASMVVAQVRPFIVQDPPKSPVDQQKMFHLPDGFRIELVASEPDVINPINLNFDAAGRLYVSQSLEYPIPGPTDRPGRDVIYRIEDSNGDGLPNQVSTFAEGLHIPIGVVPVRDGVLGFSIPELHFFADQNHDGKADRSEIRFKGFGFEDTHGMISSLTWWVDGWVYGCHGFVNTSKVAGTEGEPITMVSGNTYRLRADGSRIEHYAHGQVNPFGLTFDSWGNVFTADCHTRPATMLLRGAHYPRSQGDGLGLGPELMQHSHGSTGIAGIVYYAADQFPESYHGSLFIGNPITGRINHDQLTRSGSTYTALEKKDFLICDDPWFRPVDLQLGLDGALYIADMYNCIIGHYEVPLTHPKRDREHGRIWRVRYVGDGKTATESRRLDLSTADVHSLLSALGDPNLVVRTQATHQLVERIGDGAIKPARALLRNQSTAEQRAHILWVLHRLGALQLADWKLGLADLSPLVRTHVIKILAGITPWDNVIFNAVRECLNDGDGFVRRAAVEALGRHPRGDSIEALLRVWDTTDLSDTQLIHATKIALRNVVQASANFARLEQEYQDSPQELARLADIAPGIPTTGSAEFLWQRFLLRHDLLPTEKRFEALKHIVRYLPADELPNVMSLSAELGKSDRETQLAVVSAIHQGARERGIAIPQDTLDWGERLVESSLESTDVEQVRRGIELTSQLRLPSMADRLVELSTRDSPYPSERTAAILALVALNLTPTPEVFFTIVNDDEDVPLVRQFLAETLANRKDRRTRLRVLDKLTSAPQLVSVGLARGLVVDQEGAAALLEAIEGGKVSPRVLQDAKVQRLLPVCGLPRAKDRAQKLVADLPPVDVQVDQRITESATTFRSANPNVIKGAAVFKKICANCHQLENQGAKVGPELDGIGHRGLSRLLEDILDPNRAVDKKYRATLIATVDGRVINGLVTAEVGQVVVVTDQLGKEHRIPSTDIEQRRQIDVSAMPSNFGDTLKEAELVDLLAFLLTKTPIEPVTQRTD